MKYINPLSSVITGFNCTYRNSNPLFQILIHDSDVKKKIYILHADTIRFKIQVHLWKMKRKSKKRNEIEKEERLNTKIGSKRDRQTTEIQLNQRSDAS